MVGDKTHENIIAEAAEDPKVTDTAFPWSAENAHLFPGRDLPAVFANRTQILVGANGFVRFAFGESIWGEDAKMRVAVTMPILDAYETAKLTVQMIENQLKDQQALSEKAALDATKND